MKFDPKDPNFPLYLELMREQNHSSSRRRLTGGWLEWALFWFVCMTVLFFSVLIVVFVYLVFRFT